MATPPPVRDLSARKRVKPGRDNSDDIMSGESHVSQMQIMSMCVSDSRMDRSLILGRRLRIFIERIFKGKRLVEEEEVSVRGGS